MIDKDFASSLLARKINADLFLISTAVEKVALNFGKPDQKWMDRMTLSEAKEVPSRRHALCQRIDGAKNPGDHLVPGSGRQRSADHEPREHRAGDERRDRYLDRAG